MPRRQHTTTRVVHTFADDFERWASGNQDQHEHRQPRNSEEKSPKTQGDNPLQLPRDDTQQATPHEATAPSPSTPHNARGFSYSPPHPQADTEAYTFHQESENLFHKLPMHTPTEYQLIQELVKLNTGTPPQPMTPKE